MRGNSVNEDEKVPDADVETRERTRISVEIGTDGLLRMRRTSDNPQFNTGSYEKFTPTLDAINEIVSGLVFFNNALFIPEESKVTRGDRFETYEILLRLPSDYDFTRVIDTYDENLSPGFRRNDWVTELGRTTCFRQVEKDRNTVISIIGLKDSEYVDVKIRYHQLAE